VVRAAAVVAAQNPALAALGGLAASVLVAAVAAVPLMAITPVRAALGATAMSLSSVGNCRYA